MLCLFKTLSVLFVACGCNYVCGFVRCEICLPMIRILRGEMPFAQI